MLVLLVVILFGLLNLIHTSVPHSLNLSRPCSFDSITEDDDAPIMDIEVTNLFSVAMALRKKSVKGDAPVHAKAKANWKKLLRASQTRADPWDDFQLDALPVENVVRYRYNALRKTWREDRNVAKVEKESFGRGAMRECFRM